VADCGTNHEIGFLKVWNGTRNENIGGQNAANSRRYWWQVTNYKFAVFPSIKSFTEARREGLPDLPVPVSTDPTAKRHQKATIFATEENMSKKT
jgi:hypothetical protein